MFCSQCGAKNPEEARFCCKCGNPIVPVAEPQPQEALKTQRPACQAAFPSVPSRRRPVLLCVACTALAALIAAVWFVSSELRRSVLNLPGPGVVSESKRKLSLNEAILARDLEQVEGQLGDPGALNAKSPDGRTPLQLAVAVDDPRIIRVLLSGGADSRAADLLNRTPLVEAIEADALEATQVLLAKASEGNSAPDLNELLLRAAVCNAVKVAGLLLDRGASPKNADKDGQTALHAAARRGHTALVELLLAKDADANAADKKGNTPLHLAVLYGRTQAVATLLAHGANVNAKNQIDSEPLHLAARCGSLELVKMLLDKGANAKIRAPDGTPKEIAAAAGNTDVLIFLAAWDKKQRK